MPWYLWVIGYVMVGFFAALVVISMKLRYGSDVDYNDDFTLFTFTLWPLLFLAVIVIVTVYLVSFLAVALPVRLAVWLARKISDNMNYTTKNQ